MTHDANVRITSAFVVLAVLGAAPWFGGSVQACPEPPAVDASGPTDGLIVVDGPENASLGRVAPHVTVSHSRAVTNHSKETLHLSAGPCSCVCVTVTFSKEAIGPGESSEVTIATPVLATALPQSHYALIRAKPEARPDGRASDRAPSEFRLSLDFTADINFIVKPESLWFYAVESKPVDRTVVVRAPSIKALDVKNIRSTVAGITLAGIREFAVPVEFQPPTEEGLAIRLRGEFGTPGLFEGRVEFDTSHPDFSPAWIPVQARVLPMWIADPDGFAIILEHHEAKPFERTLRVATRDGSALPTLTAVLENVDSEPESLRAFAVRLEADSKPDAVIVHLGVDTAALGSNEGLARVVLASEDARFKRILSIAWVRRFAEGD